MICFQYKICFLNNFYCVYRMTITHNPKGPASTLNIKSVQVFDEDSYVCETTFLEPMENCENTGSFSIGLQVYGNSCF